MGFWRNSPTRLQSKEPPTQDEPAPDLEVENGPNKNNQLPVVVNVAICEAQNQTDPGKEDRQTTQRLILPSLQVVLERGAKIELEALVYVLLDVMILET